MSKNNDPAVLFYISNWLTSTAEMDADERGWYLNLLLHQYDKGSLPHDIEKLATLAVVKFSEFERFKEVFEKSLKYKFTENEEGRLENSKMKQVIKQRETYKEKRRLSGKIGQIIKKVSPKQSERPKYLELISIMDEESINYLLAKNKQVLKQVLKHLLKLYINRNININNINISYLKELEAKDQENPPPKPPSHDKILNTGREFYKDQYEQAVKMIDKMTGSVKERAESDLEDYVSLVKILTGKNEAYDGPYYDLLSLKNQLRFESFRELKKKKSLDEIIGMTISLSNKFKKYKPVSFSKTLMSWGKRKD